MIHRKETKKEQWNAMEVYDQTQFDVTEAIMYYLNNAGSVEILTKSGLLMKVYFCIPKQCTLMTDALSQSVLDEMTETNPKESIKLICARALALKGRLGVQKKGSRLGFLSRFILNNNERLANIAFLLLFVNLWFEIWRNTSDSNIADLLRSLTIFMLIVMSIMIFVSYFFESYTLSSRMYSNSQKSEISSEHSRGVYSSKSSSSSSRDMYQTKKSGLMSSSSLRNRHRHVHGSLGYTAFPKSINNTETSVDSKSHQSKTRVALSVLRDTRNITNIVNIVLLFVGIAFPQIFRALLFVWLASIDTKRVIKSRIVAKYPYFSRAGLTAIFVFLVPYFYSLSDLFFDRTSVLPVEYTWDSCHDYWTWVGAILENDIRYHESGLEKYINIILFVLIMVVTVNIMFVILFSLLIKDLQSFGIGARSSSGGEGSSSSEICLVCGKHRSEFAIGSGNQKSEGADRTDRDEASQDSSGGWLYHITKEHNIFAYFYYIIYWVDKYEEDCDGVELWVKKCVESNDISFIPQNMALSLQNNTR